MRLLILGASVRTGKYVLNESLNRGYEVNFLVRNRKAIDISNDRLNLIEGNPSDIKDLNKALKDCHLIINVLNVSTESDFPWSKLRSPSTFLSDVMGNIIERLNQRSIQRIIVCTAWAV